MPSEVQQTTYHPIETSRDEEKLAEATRGSVSYFFGLRLLTATAFLPACQSEASHQASVESSPAEDSLTLNPLYTGSSSESTAETNPLTYSSGEVMTTTDSMTTGDFATSGEIPSTTDATTELEGAESSTSTGLTTENDTSTGEEMEAICGDGEVDPGEICDDGNLHDTDECTTKCKVAKCGDGFVKTGEEECDDGNQSNSDACVNGCKTATCGDKHVQVGVEACDLGEENNDAYECTTACEIAPASCGDGEVQEVYEACEAGQTILEADLKCDNAICSWDFGDIQQIRCDGPNSPDGIHDCGQGDADIICKLKGKSGSMPNQYTVSTSPLESPLIDLPSPNAYNKKVGAVPLAELMVTYYVPQANSYPYKLNFDPNPNARWITKAICKDE